MLFSSDLVRRKPAGQCRGSIQRTTTEFLVATAGMIANVGYFLTGESVSVIAMGVAIVAFWWSGPNAFAKT